MGNFAMWLARRRVTLGFICAAAALWLARPTWGSWAIGCSIALVGELVRIWAAGHLEKDREVTSSGPYRFVGHPLYVGSTIMGIGFAVAASNLIVATLIALYLVATLAAAMRREQSFLERTFGDRYEAYRSGRNLDQAKRFSVDRARRNREYRSVAGFLGVALILAAKAAMN
jgi:protein-S-isoprenylcysteine O-methyltransferase Ste14